MAVPAEIRAVPRPKNTVVDDSGREGPKRYAVRERSYTNMWQVEIHSPITVR